MENIKQLFSNSVFLGDMSRKNRQRILNFISGADTELKGKIQVCTIVDYYCESPKEGQQIYGKLVTVINTKVDDAPAKFDYEFIRKDKKARFTLFGNPDYIIKTLQLL